jgi:very-short-patch-repair endonuclease
MTKPSLDHRIGKLAARQYGIFSREQVLSLGCGRGFIQHHLTSGRWDRVAHNVFRVRGVPDGWKQSLMAACLSWGAGATISHHAGAALRRLAGFEEELVELTVPPHRRGSGPGLVHRNRLLPVDVTTIESIPVTIAARTLIDIAAAAPPEAVEEALDDALRRGLVSIPRMRWRLTEVAGRGGRHGVALMRALLDAREETGVPQSVLETKMLRTLKLRGLPRPSLQYPVRDGKRTIAIVDFAFLSELVAVETDGYRWHSGRTHWQSDRIRQNQLTALGWRVIHVTWDELRDQPQAVAETIRRILAGG